MTTGSGPLPETAARAARRWGPADLLVGVAARGGPDDSEEVRQALVSAFEALATHCPHSPKVLLCTLAAGVETTAADLASERPGWRVVAILPIQPDLYREGYRDPADLARLDALLGHPGVDHLVLKPLRNSQTHRRYTPAELLLAAGTPDRSRHDEQAGLFIAERVILLLAVLPAHPSLGALGSGARMCAARVTGPVDAAMREVRRDSSILLDQERTGELRLGPAWVIKPGARSGSTETVARSPGGGVVDLRGGPARAESLRLAQRFNDLNWRMRRVAEPPAATARHPNAATQLERLRAQVSDVQRRLARRVRWTVWSIALLFGLAIMSLELHIELAAYHWTEGLMVAYAGLASAAVVLFLASAARRWQPDAEDYRAILEALRVQIVFWRSGLTERGDWADLLYLTSHRSPLKSIRDAVAHFASSAALGASMPQTDRNAAVRWIDEQVRYYAGRIETRTRGVWLVSATTWFLFILGLVVALCVAGSRLKPVEEAMTTMSGSAPSLLRSLVLTHGVAGFAGFFLLALSAARWQAQARTSAEALAYRVLQALAAVAGALALVGCLCVTASFLPVPLGFPRPEAWAHLAAKKLLMLAVVAPAAIAGLLRFACEKLSWEAELKGYERTLEAFQGAKTALRDLEGLSRATGQRRRRRVILDLGAEALQENEAWLIAHRERPIEPVVGA